ncbi:MULTISPECIES: copper amine oxidase N-terminal domain-containing protein [Paenibacillus]|uniref:copper amine oxidase N-terminal domain-containing protein n=1 Tax=Paenibacillus TaxID=44249 RepID=UPI00087F36EC|nr:copper amine oxidase N-terminal domain-containing protein [Paenibacillus sp. OK060]SDM15361.1 Copper amine oxidase N-terminal domain-containing protein [Paenibacillus sp. OK060]
MKKRTVIISTIVLSSTMFVTGALAASNGFSIFINGSKLSTEAKIINGTTYVPLRAISESLGAQVDVNNSQKNIYITTKTQVPANTNTVNQGTNNTPAPSNSSQLATRTNPANVGIVVPFEGKTSSNLVKGNISISEVIRGDAAWKIIYDTNSFNRLPNDGHEYILTKIKYELKSSANSEVAEEVSDYDFTLVSGSGVDYQRASVVLPDPQFRTKIYAGGSYEGWAAFVVKTDDPSPLLAYNRKRDGSSGIWFKLN